MCVAGWVAFLSIVFSTTDAVCLILHQGRNFSNINLLFHSSRNGLLCCGLAGTNVYVIVMSTVLPSSKQWNAFLEGLLQCQVMMLHIHITHSLGYDLIYRHIHNYYPVFWQAKKMNVSSEMNYVSE